MQNPEMEDAAPTESAERAAKLKQAEDGRKLFGDSDTEVVPVPRRASLYDLQFVFARLMGKDRG